MRLHLLPRAIRTRRIGARIGLALIVGSALLLGTFVPNAAAYRNDGPRYRGGPGFGHARVYHGSSWNSGPRRYRGYHSGPRVRVYAPIHRYYYRPHYYRPRLSFGLGLSFGHPYYDHPPVVVHRDRYIIEDDDRDDRARDRDESIRDRDDRIERDGTAPSEEDFDVTNEPPPGCYYHDRFCDREFSTLDDYTEHIQRERHSQTIDILERRTGDRLHTIEFVNGEWQPQIR